MEVQKNIFSKGMIKDFSDFSKPADSYSHALDIRLNSEGSENEYTITNIQGTTLKINVPTVPSILIIEPTYISTTFPITFTPQLNVNSVWYSGTAITASSYDDLFNQLETSLNEDTVFTTLNITVAKSGQRISIYSTTNDVVAFTGTTYILTIFQQKEWSNVIIGWTLINDDIYLITTENNTLLGGTGTFWKMSYDTVTLVVTLTLVYSANLKLSTIRPILNPGGIEAIYETPSIGRIYWTDRHNDLRGINVYDTNVMAIHPDRLSIDSGKTLKKATLNNVSLGGTVISGLYTVSYRLRSGENSVTSYAPESGPIHIVEAAGSGGFAQYQGNVAGTITNKQFTVNFTGIDTDYSYLDVIILRKESADARPFISKVAEIPIVNSEFNYTYTGGAEESFITEEEFTKINEIFNVCHTIAQKDNILFAANTKGENFDIEFDARAYRFDNTGKTILYKEDGTTIEFDGSAWVDSNNLANQPFHVLENTDCYMPNQNTYMYQQDGTTIGGQGPNVSYTFTTIPISGDVIPCSGPLTSPLPNPWRIPWRDVEFNIDMGDNNLYTKRDNAWPSFGSEYVDHFLRGYRREEKYRFFLVFVKDGIESYQKWIADIKMPAVHQERNGYGTYEDFPLTKRVVYGDAIDDKWNVVSLGVKFTVDVSSVADQIDGFRIKRVQLNQEDRTILGQGILHGSAVDSTNFNSFHPEAYAGTASSVSSSYTLNSSAIINFTDDKFNKLISFVSPDLLFGKGIDYIGGDSIKVVTGLANFPAPLLNNSKLYRGAATSAMTPTINFFGGQVGLFKLYRNVNVKYNPWFNNLAYPNTLIPIQDAKNVTQGQTAIVDGSEFKNFRRNNFVDESNLFSDTVVIACNDLGYLLTSLASTDTEGVITPFGTHNEDFADKLLVNYVRTNNGQYGGNGYIARSNNISINTNIDVVLDKISGVTQFTLDTFGGDTFVTLFDNYRSIRNYAKYAGSTTPADMPKIYGTVLCFPVESNVNTDLRHGVTPLKYSAWEGSPNPVNAPDPALYPIDYGEDFKYDYTWSSQPDTNRSFSKQINVIINRIHPMRIWASSKKILGERVDSFMKFKTETFIDITGKFGEIRQLINFGDKIHAFQKRAFGVASVNDRSVVNDDSGTGIVLGESGVLPRFDYISQNVGSWHQSSFATSPRGILFYNVLDSGLYLYSGEGLPDITDQKIKNWLYSHTRGEIQTNDTPDRGNTPRIGMTTTYDNRNKEFLITFLDDSNEESFTIAYADTKNVITSFRTPKPSVYINDNVNIFAPIPQQDRTIHLMNDGLRGSFFGNAPVDSELDIVINPNPDMPKVLDNLSWMSLVTDSNDNEINLDTISELTIETTQQTTGVRTNFTRSLREWWHKVVYAQGTRDRIRSHYFKVKMKFYNSNDKKFILNNFLSYYRIFQK
jgi:hypothetical protein